MHVDLEINAVCLQSPFALSIGVDRFRRACDVCGLDWDKEGDIESERQRERERERESETHTGSAFASMSVCCCRCAHVGLRSTNC